MRVLLAQPDQNHSLAFQYWARVEPLGLEMIAGALLSRHEVALLDLRLDPDGLTDTLARFRPHMVGICATFTIDIYRALGIASAVKAANPQSFVFVGGHHPSLYPEVDLRPEVRSCYGTHELSWRTFTGTGCARTSILKDERRTLNIERSTSNEKQKLKAPGLRSIPVSSLTYCYL